MTGSRTGAAPLWGSRIGFLAAALGSAVGLGNIWRFAYVAGENGGGAFVLVYAVAVAAIGLPLLLGELALGRAARRDPIGAYAVLVPSRPWRWTGWLGVLAALGILAYYPVISGWVLSYLVLSLGGQDGGPAGSRFAALLDSAGAQIAALAAVTAIGAAVVAGGVERGIERVCKIAIPVFVILLVALAGYGLTLPGAGRALAFLFAPDWDALRQPETYLAAIGQAFFSIGIGMAILVTYGGYLRSGASLPAAALTIAAGDTLIALVAGLMMFPAVFTFGLDPAQGATLAFVVLPEVFAAMPGGRWIAIAFFLLLLLAALTSVVALMEVPVALLIARRGWPRGRAAALVGCATALAGCLVVVGDGIVAALLPRAPSALELVDRTVSDILLPLSGIAMALAIGWVWPADAALAASDLQDRWLRAAWLWLLRAVLPVAVGLVMLRALGTF